MIGQFKLTINKKILIEVWNDKMWKCPSKKHPWVTVSFLIPSLSVFSYKKDLMHDEWYRDIGIDCPTRFIVHDTESFWSINIALLGFGIYISSQNGY